MQKKKITKKSKRRLAVFAPLSLGIITFFIITSLNYTFNIIKLSNEQEALKDKLISLEVDEKDLNNEILKLKDPDYLAKYAREKYYYSKDGEYVIKLEEKDDNENTSTEKKDYSKYFIYGGLFVLFIIFVFILKKRKTKEPN